MKKIRVLIVDDEPIAREGLRILLSSEPAIEIVGECRNGSEVGSPGTELEFAL